jgi:hypothetical protein
MVGALMGNVCEQRDRAVSGRDTDLQLFQRTGEEIHGTSIAKRPLRAGFARLWYLRSATIEMAAPFKLPRDGDVGSLANTWAKNARSLSEVLRQEEMGARAEAKAEAVLIEPLAVSRWRGARDAASYGCSMLDK